MSDNQHEIAQATPEATAAKEISKFIGSTNDVPVKETPKATKGAAEVVAKEPEAAEIDDLSDPPEADIDADTEESLEDETPAETDASAEDEAAKEAAKDKKVSKTVQARIGELTRARREAERRAEALEARLAALETPKALTKPADDTKSESAGKPDPSKFTYGEVDAAYIEALADWKVEQRLAAHEAKTKKERDTEAATRTAKEHQASVDAFAAKASEKFKDFNEVVMETAGKTWPLSAEMGQLIMGSKVGAEVAYHLARNPKFAKDTFGKPPLEQAAIFGRLEAKYSASPAEKPEIKAPKAPAPASTVRGSAGKFQATPATTDFAQFEALANRK